MSKKMSKKNESFERFIGTSSTILNGANTGLSLTSTFLGNVNEAVEPFLPIIATITALTKDIAKVYENVQYNKNTCGVLVNRVEAAEAAIKGLMRQREENIDKFLSQGYNKSFEKYVVCLNNIKDFCESISQLSKVKKFFTSEKIRETFLAIIKEFDGCTADLNLAITTNTYKDLATLQSDMIEMKKFLDNVGGGITSIDDKTNEIISLNKQIIKMLQKEKSLDFTTVNEEINNIFLFNEKVNNQDLTLEVKRIMSSELKDARVTREGSRVTIRKKIYKEMDIACKPIVSMDNTQKIQKHLAILEKLNICPYIIQFHGLSKIAEENVMIFEWAEYGTLRELYLNLNKNNHNIKWGIKISIARDICRGLAFLHSVNILHHDLRCENILITENMQPKISNFGLAREFNAATHPIENFVDIIHWLAPEKLECIRNLKDPKKRKDINRYTIQCEIFSFGMLLWELGFQQKPYENKSLTKILEHVLNGGREKLDIGLYSNSIKKEYCEIIRLAWEQEPSFRPEIRRLFNMLQDLYDNHGPGKLLPISQVVERPQDTEFDISNYYPIPSITPLIPFDEGIQANKEGNYEKAWKCFEQHANIGDLLAKYWQGCYYSKGFYVEKDLTKAKELLKEAVDGGISDAQIHYAFCLLKDDDHVNFLKYLKMSADNDNIAALYNLGKLYFFGQDQLGIEKDQKGGVQYLKRAALKGEHNSIKFLKNHNITFLLAREE